MHEIQNQKSKRKDFSQERKRHASLIHFEDAIPGDLQYTFSVTTVTATNALRNAYLSFIINYLRFIRNMKTGIQEM